MHVRKVDYYDHKSILKEAAFTLYSDAACTKIIKAEKTDPKSGIAVFDGLIYGTVYVKETKAPAGYQLSKEVIKVTTVSYTHLDVYKRQGLYDRLQARIWSVYNYNR